MMIGLIIKDLSTKLSKHIDEKGGEVQVTSEWVNDWLGAKGAPFIATIVDENGTEIKNAKVSIKKRQ
jgi:hypothetical protein